MRLWRSSLYVYSLMCHNLIFWELFLIPLCLKYHYIVLKCISNEFSYAQSWNAILLCVSVNVLWMLHLYTFEKACYTPRKWHINFIIFKSIVKSLNFIGNNIPIWTVMYLTYFLCKCKRALNATHDYFLQRTFYSRNLYHI